MGTSTINSASIKNSDISDSANISASKCQARKTIFCDFGLAIGDTVTDEERIVFVATNACTINFFKAKVNGAESGANSVAFDIKKNGTTLLSGDVTIGSAQGTNVQSGTFSGSQALVADDVISIEMDNTSSDSTGPLAWFEVDENPS